VDSGFWILGLTCPPLKSLFGLLKLLHNIVDGFQNLAFQESRAEMHSYDLSLKIA
jgi:hypothetical protein